MKFRVRPDKENGIVGQFVLEVAISVAGSADVWMSVSYSSDRRWLEDSVAPEYKAKHEQRERWLAQEDKEFEI